MTDPILLRTGRPPWFRLLSFVLILLALAAIALAPISAPLQCGVFCLAALAVLVEHRRARCISDHRSLLFFSSGKILIYERHLDHAQRAQFASCVWLSRPMCVLEVKADRGIRRKWVLFAACNEPQMWRRLLVRLGTGAGQHSGPELVC